MSLLEREADSADGACHETLRRVELDSQYHPGDPRKGQENSSGQAEDISNDAHEKGHGRGHLRRVSRPHSGHNNQQGS